MARTVRNRKLSRMAGAEDQLLRIHLQVDETSLHRTLFVPPVNTQYVVVRYGAVPRALAASAIGWLKKIPNGSDITGGVNIGGVSLIANTWTVREADLSLTSWVDRIVPYGYYLGLYGENDGTGLADCLFYADLLPWPSTQSKISGGGGVSGAGA